MRLLEPGEASPTPSSLLAVVGLDRTGGVILRCQQMGPAPPLFITARSSGARTRLRDQRLVYMEAQTWEGKIHHYSLMQRNTSIAVMGHIQRLRLVNDDREARWESAPLAMAASSSIPFRLVPTPFSSLLHIHKNRRAPDELGVESLAGSASLLRRPCRLHHQRL